MLYKKIWGPAAGQTRETLNMFGIIGIILFHVSSGGVIQTLDACSMCGMEDNVLKCVDIEMTYVVSLEACPGSHLWTGRDLLVTELRGWATQVQLARTILECNDIPDGWLVLGLTALLGQYFSLYRAVSQREGERLVGCWLFWV